MTKSQALRECLWLVKNGVPYDVAFSLSPKKRFAWYIIFAEFEGNKFDFRTMQFIDPKDMK